MKERRMVPRQTDDRRSFNRIHTRLDVTTYVNNERFDTCMQNLSSNGILIADAPQNEINTYKECKIVIPVEKDKTIELDALVVWTGEGMVGLSFENIEHKIQSNLNRLIFRLIKKTVAVEGMSAFA